MRGTRFSHEIRISNNHVGPLPSRAGACQYRETIDHPTVMTAPINDFLTNAHEAVCFAKIADFSRFYRMRPPCIPESGRQSSKNIGEWLAVRLHRKMPLLAEGHPAYLSYIIHVNAHI